MQGVLRIVVYILITMATALPVVGQLYVGKACLSNPNDSPPVATPGQPISTCNEATYFFEQTTNSIGYWNWDFGDGVVLNNFDQNPSHYYAVPGGYTIRVKAISDNGTLLGDYSKSIKVGYYPTQPLFDKKTEADTTICKGKTITLDPYKETSAPPNVRFKWFPNGETTSTIEVNEGGCYAVEVIDNETGCSRFAKINVTLCFEEESQNGGGSEKWYFGKGSGLEFTITGDEILQDPNSNEGSLDPQPEIENPSFVPAQPQANQMNTEEAVAQVFNKSNQLVLYSDGKKIYSGEDNSEITMADGSAFALNKKIGTQGLAFVPKPICSACDFIQYYLFSVDETTGLLSYSVIDMRENNKLGAVIEKDVPVYANVNGNILSERSADDEFYFITAINKTNNKPISISIDSLGVKAYSSNLPYNFNQKATSYMATSPDGQQLAYGVVENGNNKVLIYKRDPSTNELSSLSTIDLGYQPPPSIYGVAFSPSGEFLYVTLRGDGKNIASKLLQIKLSTQSVIEISSSNREFGALALGPKYGDGSKYIYLTINNSNNIHYIQSPNEEGKDAVGFTLNSSSQGVPVPGTTQLGFPNVIAPKLEQEGNGLDATYTGNCINAPTILTAQKICDPMKNEFEWEVEGKKYTGETATHYFSKTGWHNITLTIKIYRETKIGSQLGQTTGGISGNLGNEECPPPVIFKGRIYIKPAPEAHIPQPLYVCTEPPYNGVTIDPKATGGNTFDYEWLTIYDAPVDGVKYRDPVFTFVTAQSFKLKLTNDYECSSVTPFTLEAGCEPIVQIPNVFTPNNDGINETFKITPYFVLKPNLQIYDRWGEKIFESDNPVEFQWNGKSRGVDVMRNQLYVYVLKYFARDFPERGEHKHKGTVLLLSDQ